MHAEKKSETRGGTFPGGVGRRVVPGVEAKGHDEGIENKWMRDSAIFRWCRVFRPGDSALSPALRFHRSSIPSISSPVSLPPHPAFAVLFGSGAGCPLVTPVPRLSFYALPFILKALVQKLGAIAPRESLVSGYALPLTVSHRKPIETSRISPFG